MQAKICKAIAIHIIVLEVKVASLQFALLATGAALAAATACRVFGGRRGSFVLGRNHRRVKRMAGRQSALGTCASTHTALALQLFEAIIFLQNLHALSMQTTTTNWMQPRADCKTCLFCCQNRI
jgi:hypothetical protein